MWTDLEDAKEVFAVVFIFEQGATLGARATVPEVKTTTTTTTTIAATRTGAKDISLEQGVTNKKEHERGRERRVMLGANPRTHPVMQRVTFSGPLIGFKPIRPRSYPYFP